MDLEKLKNKEARVNAMAFSRLETGLDDEFFQLLQVAEKLTKLENDKMAFFSAADPDKRANLQAVDAKLAQIRRNLDQIRSILDEAGISSKKFIKNSDDFAKISGDFARMFNSLDKKLPDGMILAEISPYLGSFNDQ